MIKRASLLLLPASLLLSGCGTSHLVLNPRVNPSPVVFESDQARVAFVDEIRDRHDDGDAVRPPGELSRHAYYNQEVMAADGDGDGIISDTEAYNYINEN
jgi:hypothetical protein